MHKMFHFGVVWLVQNPQTLAMCADVHEIASFVMGMERGVDDYKCATFVAGEGKCVGVLESATFAVGQEKCVRVYECASFGREIVSLVALTVLGLSRHEAMHG